jgi:hypothetical protein
MSLITAKTSSTQVAVLSGTVMMPLYGVWTADLVLDNPDRTGFDEGTQVDLVAVDGFMLSGTVAADRTGDFLDATHVRIVGGAGGMGKTATAKGYVQPSAFVRDVVNGLMNDSGEKLSSSAAQSFLTTNLTAWMVTARPVSECLDVLIELVAPTLGWRIRGDGKLWIGSESWASSDIEFTLLLKNPVEGFYDLGVQSPSIAPGVTLPDVGKVSRVEHTIESDKIRSRVWVPTKQQQGVADYIETMIDHRMAKIDYFAFYDATVKSQSSDGTTVDLDVADKRIGGLQRVALRHGLAATTEKIANGSKIRLGWDRGDPRYPFAAIWDGGETVTRISIAGDTDAARKGDHSDGGNWVFTFGAGSGAATLSIVYTDPDGTVTTLPLGSGTVPAKAKLTEGSSKVGLG